MAIYRCILMTFWTDSKISDDFSPDERYFYLYLLTNPHTNLCGCYEISVNQISYETGFDKKKTKSLIDKLSEKHDVIRYCADTKEVLVLKWHKYNWTESEKFRKPLLKEINAVKCEEFRQYLSDLFNGKDTVSIGYRYGIDTVSEGESTPTDTTVLLCTDTVSDTDTDTDSEQNNRTKSKSKQFEEEFDKLWKLYPKKQGHKKALEYYQRARENGTTYEQVEEGIKAYAEYVKATKQEDKYIKHGSTFFSQESWLDEWSVPQQSKTRYQPQEEEPPMTDEEWEAIIAQQEEMLKR